MPTWIVLAALATILVTGALTWVFWRLNAPVPRQEERRGDDGDGGGGGGK